MTLTHSLHAKRRAPRFRIAETIPAAFQLQDSSVIPGVLQVISRTGGLLSLSGFAQEGSSGTLVFRTHRGLVSGTVEMLRPVFGGQQPFRFMGLEADEENRMQAAFQSRLYRNLEEEEWIEEFRAAVRNWSPPRQRHFFKPIVAAATVATLCLGSLLYALSAHLLR